MLLRLPRAFARRVANPRPLFFTPSRPSPPENNSGQRHFGGGGSRPSYDAKLAGKGGKVNKAAKVTSSQQAADKGRPADPTSSSSSSSSSSRPAASSELGNASSESSADAQSQSQASTEDVPEALPFVSFLPTAPKTVSLDAFFSQERPLLEVTLAEDFRRSATDEHPLLSSSGQPSSVRSTTAPSRQSLLYGEQEEDAYDIGLVGEPNGADPEWPEGVASHLSSLQPFVPPPRPTPVKEEPVTNHYDSPTRSAVAFLSPFEPLSTSESEDFMNDDQDIMGVDAGHYLHKGIMHHRWSSAVEWSKVASRFGLRQTSEENDSTSSSADQSRTESLSKIIEDALRDSRRLRRRYGPAQRRPEIRIKVVGGRFVPNGNKNLNNGLDFKRDPNSAFSASPASESSSFFKLGDADMKVFADIVSKAFGGLQDGNWVLMPDGPKNRVSTADRSPAGPRILNQRGRVGMDSVRRKRRKKMSKHKYKKRRFVLISHAFLLDSRWANSIFIFVLQKGATCIEEASRKVVTFLFSSFYTVLESHYSFLST
jgi:hypothetical protein